MSSHTKSDHFFAKYLKNDAPVISYKERKTRQGKYKRTTEGFTPVKMYCLSPLAVSVLDFWPEAHKTSFHNPTITYQFYFTLSSLSPETVRPSKFLFFCC